jgi:hypothetical protein
MLDIRDAGPTPGRSVLPRPRTGPVAAAMSPAHIRCGSRSDGPARRRPGQRRDQQRRSGPRRRHEPHRQKRRGQPRGAPGRTASAVAEMRVARPGDRSPAGGIARLTGRPVRRPHSHQPGPRLEGRDRAASHLEREPTRSARGGGRWRPKAARHQRLAGWDELAPSNHVRSRVRPTGGLGICGRRLSYPQHPAGPRTALGASE